MTERAHGGIIEPARIDVAGVVVAVARLCLAAEFMLFGSRKFLHPINIYTRIVEHGLPGELVYIVQPWQLVFGICVFIGFQTRLASLALFGFCIIAPSIFWLDNLENLTRDYATAGGFLFLFVYGPGAFAVDARTKRWRDLVAARFSSLLENTVLTDRVLLLGRALIALPFLADVPKKFLFQAKESALLTAGGLPIQTLYLVVIAEAVFGLMLLVGYRTTIAATGLLIWALVLAFVFHNPGPQIGVGTKDIVSVIEAMFASGSGLLTSFGKDLGTIGGLVLLLVYGPSRLTIGEMERRRLAA
jgi:putative oxidoreductase